jgi:hypothetical protein
VDIQRALGKEKAGHKALLKTVCDKYTGLTALLKRCCQRSSLDVVSVQRLVPLFAYGADTNK